MSDQQKSYVKAVKNKTIQSHQQAYGTIVHSLDKYWFIYFSSQATGKMLSNVSITMFIHC